MALWFKCPEAVELPLSREDVDVDAKSQNKDQLSSLKVAAYVGCDETIARMLLCRSNRQLDSFSRVQSGTILHIATCERNSQTFLRVLLKEKTNLDLEILGRSGDTPLRCSINWICPGAVSLLLKAGVDVKFLLEKARNSRKNKENQKRGIF